MATERPAFTDTSRDRRFMKLALALAERQLGTTAPNPAVGCVIVQGDAIVGRAATARGGRPHAETLALAQAREAARGATAYVSLEPCAHQGVTPPCADALLAANIGRVVVALEDPDSRVAGRGVARLREAGLAVDVGCCADEAKSLNAGFLLRVKTGRPLVTLKIASSLDGRIALKSGESQWITGDAARALGHFLRATHDAILIGSGTALADDPSLTCRLPGLESRTPVRVVADGRLRLSPQSQLARTANAHPTWCLTRADADENRHATLSALGVEIIPVAPAPDGGLDPQALLAALGARGITRLLVEGGARLGTALLRADLVDRLAWFRGNLLIGGDGVPAVSSLVDLKLADALRWRPVSSRGIGQDRVDFYEAKA